jgi:hypothetical protein
LIFFDRCVFGLPAGRNKPCAQGLEAAPAGVAFWLHHVELKPGPHLREGERWLALCCNGKAGIGGIGGYGPGSRGSNRG